MVAVETPTYAVPIAQWFRIASMPQECTKRTGSPTHSTSREAKMSKMRYWQMVVAVTVHAHEDSLQCDLGRCAVDDNPI